VGSTPAGVRTGRLRGTRRSRAALPVDSGGGQPDCQQNESALHVHAATLNALCMLPQRADVQRRAVSTPARRFPDWAGLPLDALAEDFDRGDVDPAAWTVAAA